MVSRRDYLAVGGLAAFALAATGTAGGDEPNGGDKANTLQVSKYGDFISAAYPDVPITVETSGRLELRNSPDTVTVENGAVTGRLSSPSDTAVIDYNGSVTRLDWQSGPIHVTKNGSRVDPYEQSHDGPRYRYTGGDDTGMIEVTVYETASLRAMNDYTSQAAFARWLAGALREHDLNHDILYNLPTVSIGTDSVACDNRMGSNPCDTDGCNSLECCSIENAKPGAYYPWNDVLHGTGYIAEYNNKIGGGGIYPYADTFVQRSSSNVLLTGRGGGGCGSVTGNTAVAGGARLDTIRDYEPGTAEIGGFAGSAHDAMHEFGHNMGFAHRGPDYCHEDGGGIGFIDEHGRWNRTPCNPWNGCTNRCGTEIPDRSGTTSPQTVKHIYFTECTATQFRQNMSGEQGNVAAIPMGGPPTDNCETCDVYDPSEATRAGSESAECSCGCDGACGC